MRLSVFGRPEGLLWQALESDHRRGHEIRVADDRLDGSIRGFGLGADALNQLLGLRPRDLARDRQDRAVFVRDFQAQSAVGFFDDGVRPGQAAQLRRSPRSP